MMTLNDGRAELWQWDTGRTLSVDADCSQVHFSNKVFGRSIDVDVVDGAAVIPDILLQTDKDLNVWAFVGTADNGYTKISKTFKVNRRNKPADYVFTPPEQTTLEQIKERLEYLEQNPVEAPVQSVNGQTGTVELTAEDVGAISDETDPTVPEWAKQPTKPTYTAAEVGALPDTYTPPNQTAQQVGADPAGTAASAVSKHNTDATSHNDLRLALKVLSDRINVVLDSDDATLDQMSEVVAYIKSNKSMIDAITTSKVNVTDIVNNLTTNIINKPLSAAQGALLKEMIDALSNRMTAYRTAAAQDIIDSGKVDKVTGKGLSSNDYTDAAKAKVDALAPVATSGNYDDLKNKPIIPAPVTEQTVRDWGFTKNTGTYSKPTGGIPKADLASGVQACLEKADTSVQTDDLDDYALKSDLPINVKDFGAKGDGVTDDTTAVQNALNAAQGKTLIIDGVCKITAPLIVKDNTEIIGIGSRASGFDSHVAGTLFTSANDKGVYQCLFRNLRLRNRNLSPTDTDGQYIGQVFSSLYESRVTECYIEHFAQICDRMARISSIDHCDMYYINKSLVNDVIDSMIESNYINARNTAAGRTIMVYGLFSNSMFANNFCDYWGTAFRLESGSKPSNVIGNTFDNCVSVFRDYVVGLSIVGNNYTNIKYVSANWQAGGQPSATIQATKWSVFKFDGATAPHTGASTQCCLLDTTFNSNTFGNCSYYIYVENGVSVYPVQRCKFSDNAWEGLLVDAAFTNPQSAYDNGGMRTVYFDFWEGQSVDVLPSANLVSNAAKSVATYDGMTLWYKKREIRNFNGAWRFADGSILSNEIWDLADRTYLSRTVPANTPRTYSTEHWYKVGYNGSEYTDAVYTNNPIVSNITKNGFTIQTKNTSAGLGFYLPYGEFTFSATLPTGIEAYLLVVPASGTLESRNKVASGATLKCNDVSKSYVLLFCSRTTIGTYSVSNISIRDKSYAEVSTAPYYMKEESQTKSIADIAGYYTSDTVEGALAEIGGTLAELKASINTIRGVS